MPLRTPRLLFGVYPIRPNALRHIAEIIRPPERYLILTDSLSSIKAMLYRKIAHQTHPLVYECKQLCCARTELRWSWFHLSYDWWEMNWSISGHERRLWKAPFSTDYYLRAISRVWLYRRWREHDRQNGTLRIPVGSPILFFQIWHFGPGLRAKRRREALFALCQGFYLDIALFDPILVDFEFLKIWCVCVCVQVIMRQWTTWFDTVKDSGWKNIVLLMRLPRWIWVLGSPFVICVHWRSGVPWSVAWTSLEGLG
jgi:hypothetical protein